jgi:hypothetical protein
VRVRYQVLAHAIAAELLKGHDDNLDEVFVKTAKRLRYPKRRVNRRPIVDFIRRILQRPEVTPYFARVLAETLKRKITEGNALQ